MKLNKIFITSTAAVLLTASISAFAAPPVLPVTIMNITKSPFTVAVNNHCSAEFGVIREKESRVVVGDEVEKLCKQNISNCEVKIFKSNDCSGQQISDFTFDIYSGVRTFHTAQKFSLTVVYLGTYVVITEAL